MMDHQYYLWMSYGATALALAAELWWLRRRRAHRIAKHRGGT
jgi:heme exporter protein CcmD